jgi:hypothetical protein
MKTTTLDLNVKKTASFLAAQESLPSEHATLFEELVSDYQCAAVAIHGWKISSPKVLAELIRLGWRKT